jgi:hypothetical protein
MSITVDSLLQNLNTYFGDSTEDRVTDIQRYQALTESTAWLLEELGNEHMVESVDIDYYDTLHTYKVTGILPDLLVGADLRRQEGLHSRAFSRKSPRELAEELGQATTDPSWATERIDGDLFMMINYPSTNTAQIVDDCDSVTGWTAYTSGSDALNVQLSTNEFKQGSASISFDVDVSQSVSNFATVYKSYSSLNLENHEDLSGFLLDLDIPDVTYVSSITLYWGSGSSLTPATRANYWSRTVTTDLNGSPLVTGWNQLLFDWQLATATGTPDATAVTYFEVRVTYTASQPDDTNFRLDYLRVSKPERLTFNYVSWNVGEVSTGDATKISAFTTTTNVPFFSGSYDQYRYPVAHKAASILFYSVRLGTEAEREEVMGQRSLARLRKNFESSKTKESRSWKIAGVNLRRRSKLRRY